jgi:acyl-CoA thioester hydrolase
MNRPAIRRSRRIEFADTDASGRAHFTALLRHVEAVEHELLAELAIPLIGPEGGWPRVRVEADFRAPLQVGDEMEVTITVGAVGKASIDWRFEICGRGGDTAAEGRLVTVRVGADRQPAAIPAEWRRRLGGEA